MPKLHAPSRRELLLASGTLFAWTHVPKLARAEGRDPRFLTIVLRGALVVESEGEQITVQGGQGVHTRPGEWVRYSTPGADGAEYISVCVPAFAPGTVHRDD